jgi:hypothetical protein
VGTVVLKLYTDARETTHTFHVVGKEFGIECDGIKVEISLKLNKRIINYCDQQIVTGDEVVKFHSKSAKDKL